MLPGGSCIEVMADLWEDKGYRFLGLKSQNLQDQASRLEKMEQEQNYTQNTSTLFESGNRLEIELDDIEEKAPKENNIQADLRNIQNNRGPVIIYRLGGVGVFLLSHRSIYLIPP